MFAEQSVATSSPPKKIFVVSDVSSTAEIVDKVVSAFSLEKEGNSVTWHCEEFEEDIDLADVEIELLPEKLKLKLGRTIGAVR